MMPQLLPSDKETVAPSMGRVPEVHPESQMEEVVMEEAATVAAAVAVAVAVAVARGRGRDGDGGGHGIEIGKSQSDCDCRPLPLGLSNITYLYKIPERDNGEKLECLIFDHTIPT